VCFCKETFVQKTNLGLSKKHLGHVILFDQTNALYRNRNFEQKFYNDFEYEIFQTDVKPTRDEFQAVNEPKSINQNYNRSNNQELGYCIRTGVRIPFDPSRPFSYEAYQSWAIFENWNYPENIVIKQVNFLMEEHQCQIQFYSFNKF